MLPKNTEKERCQCRQPIDNDLEHWKPFPSNYLLLYDFNLYLSQKLIEGLVKWLHIFKVEIEK